MAQPFAIAFYHSKEWLKCRAGYIASVFGLCERCRVKGILTKGKIVHHKIKLTAQNISDPDVSLNWDNLYLVCKDCHEEEHSGENVTRSDVLFDGEGNLIKR